MSAPDRPALPPSRRIAILGNSGSGKTTLAARLAAAADPPLARLCLDAIAWRPADPGVPPERRPVVESVAALDEFRSAHEGWVIEGCYADLIEALLPHADELVFLNPGVEACVENQRRRAWEPEKYATAAEQASQVEMLIAWVREYETRDDEYGLARHRAVYEAFPGRKREWRG